MLLQALIWDLDGTLAETERDGHLVAFNDAFEAHGVPWRWSVERYAELLRITGGRERLLYDMARQPEAPRDGSQRASLARALHEEKNRRYARIVERGGIALRPGTLRLMREAAAAGLRQGIASTTTRSNANALLATHLGPEWQSHFDAVICGEDAPQRKPDPQCYLRCLEALDLDPEEALAIEDSPNGLAAACAAGLATLVTRSRFFASHGFTGAMAICDSLDHPAAPAACLAAAPARVDLPQLRAWHAAWWQHLQAAVLSQPR